MEREEQEEIDRYNRHKDGMDVIEKQIAGKVNLKHFFYPKKNIILNFAETSCFRRS